MGSALFSLALTAAATAAVLFVVIFVVLPIVWSLRFARAEAHRRTQGLDAPAWEIPAADVAGGSAVVLIHGTFARRAPWTLADSRLSQALRGVAQVVRFDWSGANSMRSRRLAAEGLRTCIAELTARGVARIAIVAHSHGGNVALKACELPATAANVRAIVCLATPFISMWRPRSRLVRPGARPGIFLMVLVILLLVPGMIGLPSYFSLAARLNVDDANRAASLGLLLAYFGIGIPLAWLVARRFGVGSAAAEADNDVAASVCDPVAIAPLADRTLVVTSGGDEADGVLKMASALNRSLVAGSHWRPTRPGEVRAAVEQVDGRTILGQLGERLSAAVTHVPAAIANLAFGADGLSVGPSLFFTSSEIPVGTWQHRHIDGAGRPDETTIAHSSLYDDPRVIEEIVAWIRAGGQPTAPVAGSARL
jgi:pimeloyl-ACP methyl ester carboxylesterase